MNPLCKYCGSDLCVGECQNTKTSRLVQELARKDDALRQKDAEIADLREQAICAEMVRRTVENGLVEEVKFLKASVEDYKQQLVKRDSDDANENEKLHKSVEAYRLRYEQQLERAQQCEAVKSQQTTTTPTIAGNADSSDEPKAGKADVPETSAQPTPSEDSPSPTKLDASDGKMFVVIAHRGGDPENHSYPVGIATNLPMAVQISKNAEAYRGGKYACSIWKFDVDQWDLEAETEEVCGWPEPIPGWKTAVERLQESIEIETENQRLRAALERCRGYFKKINWMTDGTMDDMEKVCAEALEGKS